MKDCTLNQYVATVQFYTTQCGACVRLVQDQEITDVNFWKKSRDELLGKLELNFQNSEAMQTTTPTPSTGQQLPEVQNDLIYNWTVKRIVKFEGNEYVVASIPIKCVDFEWKNAHGKSAR